MALTTTGKQVRGAAELTDAPEDELPTGVPEIESVPAADDAELAALRAQLAEAQQKIVALETSPSQRNTKGVPEGHERVVPQGDFDLFYGGAKYKFTGGQPVIVPLEVANHLRSVKLRDSQTQAPIQFDGNSLFRSTNA